MNAEERASRRVRIPARSQPASSDANKARMAAAMETVEAKASQIVAERVVAASDSEREGSQSPRLLTLSTERWKTTGSRLVSRNKVSS